MDRVFDESLNFRKIPPVISTNKAPEINGKPVELRPRAPDSLEPRALRRRTWNREEVRSNTESITSRIYQHGGIHLLVVTYQTSFLCVFRQCWTACCSIQFLSCPPRSDTLSTKQQEKSGNYICWYHNILWVTKGPIRQGSFCRLKEAKCTTLPSFVEKGAVWCVFLKALILENNLSQILSEETNLPPDLPFLVQIVVITVGKVIYRNSQQ